MFYLCDQRPDKTFKKWSSVFKNGPKPLSSMLKVLIAKFEQTGSMADEKATLRPNERQQGCLKIITTAQTSLW